MAICVVAAKAQDDRDTVLLPVIGKTIGYLDNAAGWMKNTNNQWVSRPNRIAGDYVGENAKYIDYQKQGLGIDNFILFQLNEMSYNGTKYLLFSRQSKSGYYKYPQVKEGWMFRDRVFLYVFNPDDFLAVDSIKYDTLNAIAIPALYTTEYESSVNNNTTLAVNVKKAFDGAKSYAPTCDLYILVKPFSDKQIVRFLIYNRPVGPDFGLDGNGIKTRYYETSIDNFKKLFPGVVLY